MGCGKMEKLMLLQGCYNAVTNTVTTEFQRFTFFQVRNWLDEETRKRQNLPFCALPSLFFRIFPVFSEHLILLLHCYNYLLNQYKNQYSKGFEGVTGSQKINLAVTISYNWLQTVTTTVTNSVTKKSIDFQEGNASNCIL